MTIDFLQLRAVVCDAAKRAFTEIRASHPDEHFYAFALYTDDGAMTIMPAANTEEGFRQKVPPNSKEANYYRWAVGEWVYEASGQEAFQDAYDLLNTGSRYEGEAEEDDTNFAAFKLEVIETMIASLSDLDGQGFFGSGAAREQVTLFVSISDSDDSETTENTSAQRLNPVSVSERFVRRYQ